MSLDKNLLSFKTTDDVRNESEMPDYEKVVNVGREFFNEENSINMMIETRKMEQQKRSKFILN